MANPSPQQQRCLESPHCSSCPPCPCSRRPTHLASANSLSLLLRQDLGYQASPHLRTVPSGTSGARLIWISGPRSPLRGGLPQPPCLKEEHPAAPIPLCGLAFSRSSSHRPSLPHVSFLLSPHTRSSPRTDLCALGAMLTGVQWALLLNEAPPPHRVTDCAKAERGSARSPSRRGHSACPRRAPALPSVRHSPTCSPLSFR